MSQFNTPKSLSKLRVRPYQKEAIGTVLDLVKDQIRDVIINPEGYFSQSALLEMATGSGKTFTVGKILEKIITLRDKYNSINTANEFEGLNVVFLTNRIGGLEQFRDDLLHGRNGSDAKNPIISDNILKNIQSYTFHSQADNLDDFDGRAVKTEDEVESFSENTQKTKDHFYFSTFQTAFKKDIHSKLDYVDLIIIDEAHNVNNGSDFKQVLEMLSQKKRNGKTPMILPVTATPSNLTKELFGEAMFEFGLAEYLASEYSPSVAYNLITASDASPSEIQALKILIEDTKTITDVKEKKTRVKEIEERFNDIMSSYPKLENLVEDLLARLLVAGDGEIEETIIFANSIQEADDIAKVINTEMKENIALSSHSKNKNNNALGRLTRKNDPIKIIIAVEMYNESVDLPTVSHVVFWRSTDVAKIFLQQFGRGLRGDGLVQYWDYVGSMKNFSWIGNIYEQYKEFPGGKSREQNGGTKASKFQLLGGNKSSQEHEIDLSELGFTISKLKNELPNNLTKEQLFQTLWNYEGKTEQESYDYFMGLTYKGIKKLEIGGNKVLFLRTLSGIQSEGTVETPSGFQEWIEKVFAGKNIVKQHILTKEQLLQTLWNYEGRSEQESYDYFIGLTYKGILDLEIGGKKVFSLRTLSGIQIKGDIETISGFQEWIEKVFAGKNIVKQHILTKEQLLQTLWNYEGRSEQESYDYFMGFSQKGILNLDILGNKANSLRTVSGIQIEWMIETPSGFQEWIEKVFAGKNIVKQHILTKEQLLQTLWNYEGRSEQESYDYLMGFSRKGIQDLEIGGKKVRSLLTLSGIDIKGDIQTLSGFQEWIRKVFEGKNIVKQEILTKEQLLQTLWNYEGRSEQESYDYFMGFSRKGIQDLEIGGKKVTSLRTVSGIETEGNIEASSGFQEWIRKVFEGKNIVKQEILTKEQLLQTLWNYEGKNEQESYDYLMGFTKKGIYDLEIGGNKVTSLLTLSGIEIEGKITILSGFQEWIGKVFEGKKIIRKR